MCLLGGFWVCWVEKDDEEEKVFGVEKYDE